MFPGVRIVTCLLLSACALYLTAAARTQDEAAVQVAAVLTQADAEVEVRALRAKGFDAYWVKAQVPGKGTRYRIRIGRAATEAEAQQIAAQACARRAITQFVIAQGNKLPTQASFCSALTNTARQTVPPSPKPSATKPTRAHDAAQAAPKTQPVQREPFTPAQRGTVAPGTEEITRPDAPRVAIRTAPVVPSTTPALTPRPQVRLAAAAPPNNATPINMRPAPPVTTDVPVTAAATVTAPTKNGAAAAPEACRLQPGMTGAAANCRPGAGSAAPSSAEVITKPNFTNPNWSVVQGSGATDKNLRAVYFVDRLTGWAAGDGGAVYRTDDGGKNWAELPGAVVPNGIVDVSRIHFADARNGWMLGEMRSRDSKEVQTVLLSTTDGGQIWQQQMMPGVLSFHFINSKVGWAVGRSAGVFKTTDGGLRWKKVESLTQLVGQPVEASSFNFGFSDIYFADAEHGWAVGNFYGRALTHIGGLFVTTDGGETWRRLPVVIQTKNNATRFTRGMLHAVKFTDVNHGAVTGEIEDGDETFYFTLSTRDGGQTWEQARVPSRSIQSTQFLDAARGWTVANEPRGASEGTTLYDTVLLRTENGGKSWEPDFAAHGSRIRSVFFVSPTQGWAVGDGGLILRYEAKQEKASK